jgi:NADH-quinone oxidoreductase subunit J
LTLAAPFIAAVQVIVYAGAIMVLVVFVIMLLNIEAEEHRRPRLTYLVPTAVVLGAILIGEVMFVLYSVPLSPQPPPGLSDVGLTAAIGVGLFTKYLLPFEITSILLLMAIVGAMTLARRTSGLSSVSRVLPGAAVLARDVIDSLERDESKPIEIHTTAEAEQFYGIHGKHDDD